jgi:hypothetical protein
MAGRRRLQRGRGRESDARVKKLCRLLGFGLLTVGSAGRVDVMTEPTRWKPRLDAKRRSRIVEEHRRRKGDPVVGGSTRTPQMTAYRQRALVLANALSCRPSRPRDLRILAPDAAQILHGNVYGWFERIERGCPSSDDLRHVAGFQKGGSGSSVIEIMRHAVDAGRAIACAGSTRGRVRTCTSSGPTAFWMLRPGGR